MKKFLLYIITFAVSFGLRGIESAQYIFLSNYTNKEISEIKVLETTGPTMLVSDAKYDEYENAARYRYRESI